MRYSRPHPHRSREEAKGWDYEGWLAARSDEHAVGTWSTSRWIPPRSGVCATVMCARCAHRPTPPV